MKKIFTQPLVEDLGFELRQQLALLSRLQSLGPACLLEQPTPGAWSAIQILEHLNSYSRFYLPELEKAIRQAGPGNGWYRPGIWGNYFVRLMQTEENGQPRRKMKAAKRHRPYFMADSKPVIDEFLHHQHRLLRLLAEAADRHWGRGYTKVSIAAWLHLKLGDCLRFQVAHQQRHFHQLLRLLPACAEVAESVGLQWVK